MVGVKGEDRRAESSDTDGIRQITSQGGVVKVGWCSQGRVV